MNNQDWLKSRVFLSGCKPNHISHVPFVDFHKNARVTQWFAAPSADDVSWYGKAYPIDGFLGNPLGCNLNAAVDVNDVNCYGGVMGCLERGGNLVQSQLSEFYTLSQWGGDGKFQNAITGAI